MVGTVINNQDPCSWCVNTSEQIDSLEHHVEELQNINDAHKVLNAELRRDNTALLDKIKRLEAVNPNQPAVMPRFEFWAVLENHELKEEMYGIGIIHGLHSAEIEPIHAELKEYIFDVFDVENDFPPNCAIDFIAENVSHEEGQMTFPETGQWDFPPHFEMDISIVKVTDIDEEAQHETLEL